MFCTNCGEEISDDSKFCRKCGTPVEPLNDEFSEEKYGEIEDNEYYDDTEIDNTSEIKRTPKQRRTYTKTKKSNSNILIGIAIVVIGSCLFIFVQSMGSNNTYNIDPNIQTVTIGGINFNVPSDLELVEQKTNEPFSITDLDISGTKNSMSFQRIDGNQERNVTIIVLTWDNEYDAEKAMHWYKDTMNDVIDDPTAKYQPKIINNKQGYYTGGYATIDNNYEKYKSFLYCDDEKWVIISSLNSFDIGEIIPTD